MFWTLLVVGGICYLCYRTRPTPSTFQKFYQTYYSNKAPRSAPRRFFGAVEKFLSSGKLSLSSTASNNFIIVNCLVAWLVRVEEDQEWYLGILGLWIPLGRRASLFFNSKANIVETGEGKANILSDSDTIMNSLQSSRTEKLQREAHSLKASNRYLEAAERYQSAAEQYERGGEERWMGAEMWEEAGKCWKMAGDEGAYLACNNKAAQQFRINNRNIRAATIYEKLAKYLIAQGGREEKALNYYEQAQDLFAIEEDGRASMLTIEILQLKASLNQFTTVINGFIREAERLFRQDPILINQSQRLLLMATMACCLLNDGNYGKLSNDLQAKFTWFAGSREGTWAAGLVRLLQRQEQLNEEEETLRQDIERLNRELQMMATLPDWFYRGWLKLQKEVKSSPVDLT